MTGIPRQPDVTVSEVCNLKGQRERKKSKKRAKREIQLPLCDAPIVAIGVLYLPSQSGGSSLSGTWTGSPRRGWGHGRREARGVAEGLVVAG